MVVVMMIMLNLPCSADDGTILRRVAPRSTGNASGSRWRAVGTSGTTSAEDGTHRCVLAGRASSARLSSRFHTCVKTSSAVEACIFQRLWRIRPSRAIPTLRVVKRVLPSRA